MYLAHRQKQQCDDNQKKMGWGLGGAYQSGGEMGTERDFAWDDGCMRQCAD